MTIAFAQLNPAPQAFTQLSSLPRVVCTAESPAPDLCTAKSPAQGSLHARPPPLGPLHCTVPSPRHSLQSEVLCDAAWRVSPSRIWDDRAGSRVLESPISRTLSSFPSGGGAGGRGRSQFPLTPKLPAEAPGVCAGAVVTQPQGHAANDRASR